MENQSFVTLTETELLNTVGGRYEYLLWYDPKPTGYQTGFIDLSKQIGRYYTPPKP